MSRPRRPISRDGYLLCSRKNHVVHISEFYCHGPAIVGVESREDREVTEWYGKPMSWCRECSAEYNRDRAARIRQEEREAKEARDLELFELERARELARLRQEHPQTRPPESLQWWETDEALESMTRRDEEEQD